MHDNDLTATAPVATSSGRHHQDGPDKVAVGCLVKVIPSDSGLPAVHHRHAVTS